MSLWDDVKSLATQLLTLGKETERNTSDLRELRADVKELTAVVRELKTRIDGLERMEQAERDKLVLQLENHLLKMERRLPAAPEE